MDYGGGGVLRATQQQSALSSYSNGGVVQEQFRQFALGDYNSLIDETEFQTHRDERVGGGCANQGGDDTLVIAAEEYNFYDEMMGETM